MKQNSISENTSLVNILKNFITENLGSSLSQKYNIDVEVDEYKDYIELKKIVVPKEHRNRGIGSVVMSELIKYSETNNKDLFVTPDAAYGGNVNKLNKFYRSFGFKPNKGRNRDFRSKESMVRRSK
jgi:ribosomal protein S18 acetylase RimI-like enzyme